MGKKEEPIPLDKAKEFATRTVNEIGRVIGAPIYTSGQSSVGVESFSGFNPATHDRVAGLFSDLYKYLNVVTDYTADQRQYLDQLKEGASEYRDLYDIKYAPNRGYLSDLSRSLVPNAADLVIVCLLNNRYVELGANIMASIFLLYPYYPREIKVRYGGKVARITSLAKKGVEAADKSQRIMLAYVSIGTLASKFYPAMVTERDMMNNRIQSSGGNI